MTKKDLLTGGLLAGLPAGLAGIAVVTIRFRSASGVPFGGLTVPSCVLSFVTVSEIGAFDSDSEVGSNAPPPFCSGSS